MIFLSKSARYNVYPTPCASDIWTVGLLNKLKKMVKDQAKLSTTHEVAARFHELSQQEKWFDIQDELFSEDVKSIDPPGSPYFGNAEGKATVRRKGADFVGRVEAFHGGSTSAPLVCGNHFAVGREVDITIKPHGRIQLKEIMLYEVKDGKIVSEQFFY